MSGLKRVYADMREKIRANVVVDDESGCWNWQRAITKSTGYGQTWDGDRVLSSHRAAFIEFKGPIHEGLHIDHLCRNRRCCNPDHLEAVTPQVNIVRGEGLSAQNAAKVVCMRGHDLSGDNLRIQRQSRHNRGILRVCVTCQNDRKQAWRKSRKAAGLRVS